MVGIRGNDFIELADNIIIAKFIIQNVVDSYGLNVKFSCDSSPNLTLLIQSNKTIIDKIYSAINVKQTAILTDSQRAKNFEIMALQRQEIGTKIALSIRLLCYNHFIPYLSFVELLLS